MQCKNCTTGSLLLIYTLIGCRTTWLSEVLFLLCECWELDLFQKSCLPGKVHKSNTECKNRKIGIKLHSNELINWGNLLRRQVGWGDSHVLDLWDCQYLQHSHFSCELSKWQKKKSLSGHASDPTSIVLLSPPPPKFAAISNTLI